MQYMGYEMQITDEGCIIRDSKGEYIDCMATENEAKEYIDDLIEDDSLNLNELSTDWYSRFERYCRKLPGKCYPTEDRSKFGTIYDSILDRYIMAFESVTHTKILTELFVKDSERYKIVKEVYKE